MVHKLWFFVLTILTSHCKSIADDTHSVEQPVPLKPDSENIINRPVNSTQLIKEQSANNSSNERKQYIQDVLLMHNKYRQKHGVPLLQLHEDLIAKSQSWADHLKDINKIENSLSGYGENIYVESIYAKRNGSAAVKYWYDTIQFYKPGKLNNESWNAGSFTQLIWAKSKYLGVGMAENDQFRFIVCFYDPPGNIIGEDPLLTERSELPANESFIFQLPSNESFIVLKGGVFPEENERLTNSVKENFSKVVLETHNHYRSLHGVPDLMFQDELMKESQAWADHLAATNTFQHSSSVHGENIYEESIYYNRNGTIPVKVWYDEIEFYKFGTEPEDWFKVGHFTQLIWADTKYIGVGIAENEKYRYIVCNYNPPGNIINQSHYERFIPPINTIENNLIEEIPATDLKLLEDKQAQLEKFRNEVLETHNHFRAKHNAFSLSLKDELNMISQKRAEELAANYIRELNYSSYGENIYIGSINIDRNGELPVTFWYDEIKYYTFGKEPNWSKVAHFAHIIWSTTLFLGVGLAESGDLRYVVCSYDPRGNIRGLKEYLTVLPPTGGVGGIWKGIEHTETQYLGYTNITTNFTIEDTSKTTNNYSESKQESLNNKTTTNNTTVI